MRRASFAVLWFMAGVMLVWCVGCATGGPLPTPQLRDGSEAAVHVVWVEVYGRADRPPVVHWVQGKDLSCTDPNSNLPGFPVPLMEHGEPTVECRNGLTLTPGACYVAWAGVTSFSETALAHELLHVLQLRKGIIDPNHDRPEWSTLVPAANEALVKAGL